ncbi:MAG: hypothetical protein ABI151_01070, partial [Chitinophagaceae bacterium]
MRGLRVLLAVILINLSTGFYAGASVPGSPVKIKKEIKKGTLLISSYSRQNLGLTIFLFDVQGKLLRQVLVRTNQTSFFSEIPRGMY